MKNESITSIKRELKHKSREELIQLCVRLGNFKKENKALLTYLLFESDNEESYILSVKTSVDDLFENMNTDSYFYMKKTIYKILRQVRTYSRYSLKKETEVELLIYCCEKMNDLEPSIFKNTTLTNIYIRQKKTIEKKIISLHEDLQHDYRLRLVEIQ